MNEKEFTLKNRPKAKYPANSITEKWFQSFEKKHRTFLDSRKLNDWIEENEPDFKNLHPLVILQTFIEKEILGK